MSEKCISKMLGHLMIIITYYYMRLVIVMIVPMAVTKLLIVMVSSEVHPSKAESPYDCSYIICIRELIVIVFIIIIPIDITLSGIITDFKKLHPWNA